MSDDNVTPLGGMAGVTYGIDLYYDHPVATIGNQDRPLRLTPHELREIADEVDKAFDGIPTKTLDDGRVVTRSGWSFDEDGDTTPGDRVPFPSNLEPDDAGIGRFSWNEELFERLQDDEPDLLVEVTESGLPCGYCSTTSAVLERGVIEADYALTHRGSPVVHVCHACIADVEHEGDAS